MSCRDVKVPLSWEDSDCEVTNPTNSGSTFQVKKATLSYPSVRVDAAAVAAVSSAGRVLLTTTAEVTGSSRARPHPGAQLRFADVDGDRMTAFATNVARGQLADLELRHRRRARCEDRIRIAKDNGPRNLPLKGFDQNRV